MALQVEIDDARAKVVTMLQHAMVQGAFGITDVSPGPRSSEVTVWLGERENITVSVSPWKAMV